MAEITQQLVDQMLDGFQPAFPDHVAGTRPIHTKGIGVIGWFRGSSTARSYSSAAQFAQDWIPVRVRFSNGNGQPDPDGRRQVRGMAIRFYPNGTIVDDQIVAKDPEKPLLETDLLCTSVDTFMIDQPLDLLEMQRAIVPRKVRTPGILARIRSLLAMSPIPPEDAEMSTSPNAGILAWQRRYPQAQSFVLSNSLIKPPDSYARTTYHAIHAFEVVNDAGIHHMVRFSVEPGDGVHSNMPLTDERNEYGASLGRDYLQEELHERLARGRSSFSLRMQVADPWDDSADPTRAWPRNRIRVLMGTVTLTGIAADQERFCEKMSFNPGRLLPGMGLSDDPVLRSRIAVYEASQERRGADRCPVIHG
ncbi:catalase [Ilumatobacter sp.]|uniref:catalase n=1 Tax=Ilumatobacter sp. TaxID=1967498 RepID=UPI003C4A20A8